MATPMILLVGEEPVVEDTLKVKFQSRGWRVQTVRGGGTALALMRDTRPSLVITETDLPDMPGYRLAQHIKDNPATESIPLLVLTADSDTVEKPYLYNTLAQGYMHLPFSPSQLTRTVGSLLVSAS